MTDHPETTALRLAEAATPGPWPVHRCFRTRSDAVPCDEQAEDDAAHIAHAHPGRVRAWLGAVARLRERAAEGHAEYCMTQELDARRGFRLDQVVCTCGHEDDLAALAAVDAEG